MARSTRWFPVTPAVSQVIDLDGASPAGTCIGRHREPHTGPLLPSATVAGDPHRVRDRLDDLTAAAGVDRIQGSNCSPFSRVQVT